MSKRDRVLFVLFIIATAGAWLQFGLHLDEYLDYLPDPTTMQTIQIVFDTIVAISWSVLSGLWCKKL